MDWTSFLNREGAAVFSPDGLYRYWLHRRWEEGRGWVVFVMLNPSTAGIKRNDPTVRRCIAFAKAWGKQGIIVVNLFAWRATEPDELEEVDNPHGDQNPLYVAKALHVVKEQRGVVVCAWGTHKMARIAGHDRAMVATIRRFGIVPHCLSLTANGSPRHPLYTREDQTPVPYNGRK